MVFLLSEKGAGCGHPNRKWNPRNPQNDTGRDILGITRKNNNQQDG